MLPAATDAGLRTRKLNAGGKIVRVADFVSAPFLAEMVTAKSDLTGRVVTWNVAVEAPCNTVTVLGAVAFGLELVRVTA